MPTNLRRSVVALATAFACLVLLASPASASVLTGTITGNITLINSTGTTTDTFPISSTGTGCVNDVEITVNNTTTSTTTWQITGFHTITRVPWFGGWFIAEMTRTSSTTGTVTGVTGTGATLNFGTLNLNYVFYGATDQSTTSTDCTKSTLRCRFSNVGLSLQGTYSGNVHTPATSHTVSLGGSGTLGTTTPPCNAPFTTLNGGTVSATGLSYHAAVVT